MYHHYFISSSTQIFLCSKHCFELLISTIIAICHCCIHSFVKSSEGARRWRERYRQTNCPFISCKGRKKIGHLVCWDHAAALGVVSIYIIACNKCDNICVLNIKSEKNQQEKTYLREKICKLKSYIYKSMSLPFTFRYQYRIYII